MAKNNGLVEVASHYAVEETVRRLQAAFAAKGLQVFAVIAIIVARPRRLD